MIYVGTRRGKHHKKSEDTVLVGDIVLSETCKSLPVPKEGFICVADGVGGNYGGAEASDFVLKELSKICLLEIADDLTKRLKEINSDLIQIGKENPILATMATTLTGVFVSDVSNILVHVGNTRAYGIQGRYLKQITQDHTLYNWLKSMGKGEEAEVCNKNEITSCFGGGNSSLLSKLYVTEIPYYKKLIITSDGVHEYVNIDQLEDILNNVSISNQEKCEEIINAALEAGSEDDITIVLIQRKEE